MPRDITPSQRLAQENARENLSANLKALRKRVALSQEALADKAGLHRTYVSQVERKLVNVSLDNLVLLSVALGVTLKELVIEPSEPPRKPVSRANKRSLKDGGLN